MSAHEKERLEALYRLKLLDTAPSESFDRITRMASQIFGLPIAAISLTDHDRQWFKSRVGVSHWWITRYKAPCAEVAETASFVLVPDLLESAKYKDSPLAEQGIRYYAGASLTTREGHSLGALCVLGTEPRGASDAEIAALKDLAEIVMNEIELQHAFGRVDTLSGLPNRHQLLEDLADLGRDRPGEPRLAVLVDIGRSDQLSSGLRVMGPSFLDEAIRETAEILTRELGPQRKAYHVAATQFAFLADPPETESDYVATLTAVLGRVRAGSDLRISLTTALGVTPFVTGTTDPDTVLRRAVSAAQDARASGMPVGIYSVDIDEQHQRRFRLLNDFEAALEGDAQLSLHFQPRVDLHSGACVGAEALLRWQHPELGSVSPAEFIPIVEQTALARQTTAWVLDRGLRQLSAWRAAGLELRLSLNVSAANLEQPDFAAQVQLYLLKHRVPADALEIEVTESAMMHNVEEALAQITALSEAGMHIAIDDFGTGYSSLSYLQRLPARILKIDKSFVADVASNPRERALVGSMIAMAHGLGYRVVAEGIETEAARDALQGMACDEGQGYLFGRPMPADAFVGWFRAADAAAESRAA